MIKLLDYPYACAVSHLVPGVPLVLANHSVAVFPSCFVEAFDMPPPLPVDVKIPEVY